MLKTSKAGQGTYGIVYIAKSTNKLQIGTEKEKNKEYAVKRNIMDIETSFSASIRELDICSHLKGHPYIVDLISVSFGSPFIGPSSPISMGRSKFKEDYMYFIFEKANIDGHSMIYNNNGKYHVSCFKLAMVQTLLALEYCHGHGIIHRDLKPSNLLWFEDDDDCKMKIGDFGLSKHMDKQEPQTPRVITSWYRAPEVCSKLTDYDEKIDIWSLGCIFFEMISKKALLEGMPDEDIKLLGKIINIVPNVTNEDIKLLTNGKGKYILPKQKKSWQQLLKVNNSEIIQFNELPGNGSTFNEFIELLNNMLAINPAKRLSAHDLLNLPFFKPYNELINYCRINHTPISNAIVNVVINSCVERTWAMNIVLAIYNNRENIEIYKHRILFQSIDMFDRFLNHVISKKSKLLMESKFQGKYLTKYNTELAYLVCLYICMKYFNTLIVTPSFPDIVNIIPSIQHNKYNNKQSIYQAEQLEQELINIFDTIYKPTVFEIATCYGHKLSESHICDLLFYIITHKQANTTNKQLYKSFVGMI